MRSLFLPLLVASASLSLAPALQAGDSRPPRVEISKVERGKKNGFSYFEFFIKASDNDKVRRLEYRVAVDGKDSGWVNYPYYDFTGYQNTLPFTVDCNVFSFKVRAVDRSRNKSKIQEKKYSGL